MKRTKILFAVLILLLSVALASCSPYISSYTSTFMVQSSYRGEMSLEFGTLDGVLVLTSRRTAEGVGKISVSASVGEGTLEVYYDTLGTKELLGRASAPSPLNISGGHAECGERAYIILEAKDCRDGDITISLNS